MGAYSLPYGRLILLVCVSCLVEVSLQHGFEVDPEQDPVNSLRRSDFIRDKEHLMGHIKGMKFDPDEASPEELDFHFFKLHDTNNDNLLDGLELLAALSHAVGDQIDKAYKAEGSARGNMATFIESIQRHLAAIVDKTLKDDDANNDGYISYAEFAHTRRASELLQQINTKPDIHTPL